LQIKNSASWYLRIVPICWFCFFIPIWIIPHQFCWTRMGVWSCIHTSHSGVTSILKVPNQILTYTFNTDWTMFILVNFLESWIDIAKVMQQFNLLLLWITDD
jgi:hypothetical protein